MKKHLILLLLLLIVVLPASAHVIAYELDRMEGGDITWKYIKTGFEHIIPLGFDHILFILCIFFLNTDLKKILLQATMFTVAHSITLALAMYGKIDPPIEIVEPLIAVSIVLLALENIFFKALKSWRLIMVFLFGLIHGMGFAGALSELGMPRYAFANALLSFNIGVELGQLCIILIMYLLVSRNFSHKPWYHKRLVVPLSLLIAAVGTYWTIERITT